MAAKPKKQEEVGDLFVTETAITVKLLPSKKSGSRSIGWFSEGRVTNSRSAARDIRYLVGKLQGSKRVVRGLTVMTDRGVAFDLSKTGLHEVVALAGLEILG
ncbi:MAG: hypothetical protein KGO96_00560 [Elusimicrobia bacterium]|nr:hypothetical protein [Elusimicrobiota bacterium]MDE2237404.1 hypothetical protein [Elusimicrobiota bacterium]MDE2424385.1 hypothetical protein [Elusimicrobiota bacterium]